MIAALAFLRSPVGRSLLIGLAVFALVLGLYAAGRHDGTRAEQRAEAARAAAAAKAVARREVRAQTITDQAAGALTKTRVEIQYRTRTLIQEVPIYVTPQADRDCTVPVGFVRLHDAAASGDPPGLPGPAGGPVDAASGVALSAVAETVVANYGAAFDWRAEALTWRAWYAAQKAAWDRR